MDKRRVMKEKTVSWPMVHRRNATSFTNHLERLSIQELGEKSERKGKEKR